MTEIDVVKKNSRIWLWVLIAIVIVAALFFLMNRSPDTRTGRLIEHDRQAAPAVALRLQV